MLTKDTTRYIGEVCVIDVTVSKQIRKLAELLCFNDLGIKNLKNVNYVDSKHSIKHNWMCYFLMEILGMYQNQT
tara:strand:+ start:1262 stop:1483 length:222 start_codon:yes stop_codon:yes gene_type:complete